MFIVLNKSITPGRKTVIENCFFELLLYLFAASHLSTFREPCVNVVPTMCENSALPMKDTCLTLG